MNPASSKPLPRVVVYTDGAAIHNPGPGGYAFVLRSGTHVKEGSGGVRLTTNNRMELLGVISALRALNVRCEVELHCDSKYVIDAIVQRWIPRWRARGWITSTKTPVANADLWQILEPLLAAHQVKAEWVKGHAGNPDNERCDQLATAAARQRNSPADEGFEAARAAEAAAQLL